jgi:hypothetical protein
MVLEDGEKDKIDWKQRSSAKENEIIFTEVDLSGWNEVGERRKEKNCITKMMLQLCDMMHFQICLVIQ